MASVLVMGVAIFVHLAVDKIQFASTECIECQLLLQQGNHLTGRVIIQMTSAYHITRIQSKQPDLFQLFQPVEDGLITTTVRNCSIDYFPFIKQSTKKDLCRGSLCTLHNLLNYNCV